MLATKLGKKSSLVFPDLGWLYGKMKDESTSSSSDDSSLCFLPISEECCFETLQRSNHSRPIGPCEDTALSIVGFNLKLFPHPKIIRKKGFK